MPLTEDIIPNLAQTPPRPSLSLGGGFARIPKLPEDGITQSHMSRAHIGADRSMIVGIVGSSDGCLRSKEATDRPNGPVGVQRALGLAR
ncbi:hypothetical protein THAOC_12606 [Thalassiosira oceanica]|uniref:Uncharacterized protein n=1 Tax=Thalassiosira oceanica TaxID=159749 RepID=K0SJK7_THAOC|nr:hypothetical protein THAOC_12606 [Thalassiosira oceanica]|eukprot:EJK66478.1 hypothetical protein THAOC_12606 [Thalassiosira oceanica]